MSENIKCIDCGEDLPLKHWCKPEHKPITPQEAFEAGYNRALGWGCSAPDDIVAKAWCIWLDQRDKGGIKHV